MSDLQQLGLIGVILLIIWFLNGGYDRYLAERAHPSPTPTVKQQNLERSRAVVPGKVEEHIYQLP